MTHSSEKKVVGITPQSEGMVDDYNKDAKDSVFNMCPYEIPKFHPNFDAIQLSKKAKLTDWLDDPFGSSGPGMTVSKKFKAVLSLFNLCKHEYYRVNILHKGAMVGDYWYLRLGETLEDLGCIDFQKTKFICKPEFAWMDEQPIELDIQNTDDLLKTVKEQLSLNPMFVVVPDSKLYLNDHFDQNMDFFYFRFSHTYIASERLKLEIEKSKITAVEFKELTHFGFEI